MMTGLIIPWSCFSIEPGVYLEDFGVRSEVDIFVDDTLRQSKLVNNKTPVTVILLVSAFYSREFHAGKKLKRRRRPRLRCGRSYRRRRRS